MLSIFANTENVQVTTNETSALLESSVKEFQNIVKEQVNNTALFVEKTPRHIHALEKICSDPLSEALVLLRNPLDVVGSLKKRGKSFEDSLTRYIQDNSAWLRFINHEKVMVVKYEDLVETSDVILKKLSDRYGVNLLEGNYKRLRDTRLYFQNAGANRSEKTDGVGEDAHLALRNYQMRQKIVNMNGSWKQRLTKNEIELVLNTCAPFIDRFYSSEEFMYG